MFRPLGANRWQDEPAAEDEDGDEANRRLLINSQHDHYDDDIRLTIRNSTHNHNNTPTTEYIYYTLQPGDTLHNISVRFSCPLAVIKRLNNLWSDQDFYAFTKLKLPVGRLRLITDLIEPATDHHDPLQFDSNNQYSLPTPLAATAAHFSNRFLDHPLNDNLEQQTGGDKIFKDVDTNIETARKAASSYSNHANDIMQSLAQSGNLVVDDRDEAEYNRRRESLDPNRIAQPEAEKLLNDMTDYGLSYHGLVLFVFIVCLICPLAYVIYLEETHHDSSSTSTSTTTTTTTSANKYHADQF